MQPDFNSQLYDAIFHEDIEAISTLIQQNAELDPSLISSTGLDDAAQAQFDEDKNKITGIILCVIQSALRCKKST